MALLRPAKPPIPAKYRDLPLPKPTPGFQWYGAGPFIALHLLPLLAIYTGVNTIDWVVCFALVWARMLFITGGYHRYFSHRTYKTSRWFQFVIAFLAMSSSQKGVLWWASTHRRHHKFSDTPWDVHSPAQRGFWYSHVGWIFDHTGETDMERVKDLARYPELVWLNKYWMVPPITLGVVVWLCLSWSGLLIGFMLSTAILWHATYTINSLSHVFGKRRFDTGDTSRNNVFLALLTLGEGWHNNHHHHMGSTRQGFYWWEFDITYYFLKVLSWVGLVWDLREPPAHVLEEGRQRDAARRRGTPPRAEKPLPGAAPQQAA